MDCITLLCALTNCPHLPSQDYTGPLGIDYHCLYTLYTPHHPPTYPPTYTPTHTHTTTTHALLAILTLLASSSIYASSPTPPLISSHPPYNNWAWRQNYLIISQALQCWLSVTALLTFSPSLQRAKICPW
eukprot:CAMPEP_0173304332 /NCGR_PEP_ID=MMETSP1143-20121109/19379_1 /TAXON_ID=483371 /ORGANISM="non described non described, Strain CCMP2298" /LENGTH=129 /DNA_ID=CAMNT_0014245127 /DNA_START=359 /DNA_END=746 /DNA_ORIENTATION=+